MSTSPCPACSTMLEAPKITGTEIVGVIPSHARQLCPACDTPLIYTIEGAVAFRWRLLDRAEPEPLTAR